MGFSILDYPNLVIYGFILVISIFLSETFKERASVMLFILFFLAYPFFEYSFYSLLGESKKPEHYFLFNAIWEYYLLVILCMINGNVKWAAGLYIIQISAISMNVFSFSNWEHYAKEIYYWYEIINRVLIESTILALISKDNKKGILLICFLLIAAPYAFSFLL